MTKTKLFAPIFDIPKDVLDKGRFNLNFVPISVATKGSIRSEIDGCDIPSGTLIRITDYNVTSENSDEDVYEVIGVSYVNLDKVHIVGSTQTDEYEQTNRRKFYLYDEVRGGESISSLVGDNKVKPLLDGYEIDIDGNIISSQQAESVEDDSSENEVTIDEIVKDTEDNDEDDPVTATENNMTSMVNQLQRHFHGDEEDVKEKDDIEESKKEDKPHKTFIGNPNEPTKKEVRKPFNYNNQRNFNQNNNRNMKNEKPRKSNTYASNNIDFSAIVSKAFPRN